MARHELRDIGTDFQHLTKTLVADHEKITTRRRLAIFSGVDLFVRAIDADLQC